MSVREKAIRIYRGAATDEQNKQAMLDQQELAISACRQATKWFNEVPHRVHIAYYTTRPFVEYDDLRLYYGVDGFCLKRACPRCGQTAYSSAFQSLKDLGRLLCDFRFAKHICPNLPLEDSDFASWHDDPGWW